MTAFKPLKPTSIKRMKVKVIFGLALLVAVAGSAPLRNTLDLLELEIE